MNIYIEKHAVNGGDKFIDFSYSQTELERGEIDLFRYNHFKRHGVDTETALLIRTTIITEKSRRIKYNLYDSVYNGDFSHDSCRGLYEMYKMYGKYFTNKQSEEIWDYLRHYGEGNY